MCCLNFGWQEIDSRHVAGQVDRPVNRAVVVGCTTSATRNYLKLRMSRTLKALLCKDQSRTKCGQGTSEFSMPKQAGELCHAKALFHRQASEQSLIRLGVCRHVSLDGKRCVRLNERSVGEYVTALTEARTLSW
jgi:hypothetical protein